MIVDHFLTGFVNYILFGMLILIGKILYNKGFDSYLIHLDRRGWKLFLKGIVLGWGTFLLLPITLLILGFASIEVNWDNLSKVIPIVLSSIFAYTAVSLFEEVLFRSCIFSYLLRRYSLNVAIVVSSFIFGAIHFPSYYSTTSYVLIGLINAGIAGALLCIIVVYTNSLMLPIGYHLSWNLIQDLLLDRSEFIINIKFEENILTGGIITPEAGLWETAVLIIIYIYIRNRLKAKIIS